MRLRATQRVADRSSTQVLSALVPSASHESFFVSESFFVRHDAPIEDLEDALFSHRPEFAPLGALAPDDALAARMIMHG